jgi:hypothetical protein
MSDKQVGEIQGVARSTSAELTAMMAGGPVPVFRPFLSM